MLFAGSLNAFEAGAAGKVSPLGGLRSRDQAHNSVHNGGDRKESKR